MMGAINRKALQVLNHSVMALHVYATLPDGERIIVRVIGVGSMVTGFRVDSGELQEDIRLEWITSVSAA